MEREIRFVLTSLQGLIRERTLRRRCVVSTSGSGEGARAPSHLARQHDIHNAYFRGTGLKADNGATNFCTITITGCG
jgi:hypothetical protein